MSIGFGIEDWLSPEFAFLFIQHNFSPFSPSLSLSGIFHCSRNTDSTSPGCHHSTMPRILKCLGMGYLGCKQSIWNSILCFFTWVYAPELSCSGDSKQQKPMTSNPAKTPGWFQDWIPATQSHMGRRNDSQWQHHKMCLWILDRQMDCAVGKQWTYLRGVSQPERSRISQFQINYVLLKKETR